MWWLVFGFYFLFIWLMLDVDNWLESRIKRLEKKKMGGVESRENEMHYRQKAGLNNTIRGEEKRGEKKITFSFFIIILFLPSLPINSHHSILGIFDVTFIGPRGF